MEQYFSLTVKQPQLIYKPQKQPAEQGVISLNKFIKKIKFKDFLMILIMYYKY
jgi:hypothetical protein